mgnify:FL=1
MKTLVIPLMAQVIGEMNLMPLVLVMVQMTMTTIMKTMRVNMLTMILVIMQMKIMLQKIEMK